MSGGSLTWVSDRKRDRRRVIAGLLSPAIFGLLAFVFYMTGRSQPGIIRAHTMSTAMVFGVMFIVSETIILLVIAGIKPETLVVDGQSISLIRDGVPRSARFDEIELAGYEASSTTLVLVRPQAMRNRALEELDLRYFTPRQRLQIVDALHGRVPWIDDVRAASGSTVADPSALQEQWVWKGRFLLGMRIGFQTFSVAFGLTIAYVSLGFPTTSQPVVFAWGSLVGLAFALVVGVGTWLLFWRMYPTATLFADGAAITGTMWGASTRIAFSDVESMTSHPEQYRSPAWIDLQARPGWQPSVSRGKRQTRLDGVRIDSDPFNATQWDEILLIVRQRVVAAGGKFRDVDPG